MPNSQKALLSQCFSHARGTLVKTVHFSSVKCFARRSRYDSQPQRRNKLKYTDTPSPSARGVIDAGDDRGGGAGDDRGGGAAHTVATDQTARPQPRLAHTTVRRERKRQSHTRVTPESHQSHSARAAAHAQRRHRSRPRSRFHRSCRCRCPPSCERSDPANERSDAADERSDRAAASLQQPRPQPRLARPAVGRERSVT